MRRNVKAHAERIPATIDQLTKLIDVGLVESETPKSRTVTPGFPVWFAQDIFPDLHHRIR